MDLLTPPDADMIERGIRQANDTQEPDLLSLDKARLWQQRRDRWKGRGGIVARVVAWFCDTRRSYWAGRYYMEGGGDEAVE
jgi:hypothetical protein